MTMTTTLWKAAARLDEKQIESLLPGDNGGVIRDYFMTPSSLRRAGRAAAMDEARGEDPPLSLSHPFTAATLATVPGTLVGAGLGGVLGGMIPVPEQSAETRGMQEAFNQMLGAAGGATLGWAGTMLLQTLYRRKKEREAKARALEAAGDNSYSALLPKGSILGSLLSGVHQQGRADVAEAVGLGRRRFKNHFQHPYMSIAQPLGALPYSLGSVPNYIESRGRISNSAPRAVHAV